MGNNIEFFKELLTEVKRLRIELGVKEVTPTNRILGNKDVKKMLDIGDKLLKKYRDEGLLAYTQVGDKYWYSQADIDKFLASHHYEAYKIA